MKAFFVAWDCFLSAGRLNAQRRKLAALLSRRDVWLKTLKVGDAPQAVFTRLVTDGKAAPVVTVDDAHPVPAEAPWLAALTREAMTLERQYRPRLVYVTRHATAAGVAEASRHALVRDYVARDDQGRWVDHVAQVVTELAEQVRAAESPAAGIELSAPPDIVGVSPCFRQAVEELTQILRSPYGLVTGEPGVGKMYLIRAVWHQLTGKRRVIVLPCGSFFKDYYVAGVRRRFGGGREAVDDLTPYLRESHRGLLVLHHVERLPTALQEELVVRLAPAVAGADLSMRVSGVDRDGLQEYDVTIIATSTFPPELLRQTGRLLPELGAKLRKRHVRIPSLAERGSEDVRLVCDDILRRIRARQGWEGPPQVDDAVLSRLAGTLWPENLSDVVRVLEYAVRRSRGGKIRPGHLPPDLGDLQSPAQRLTLDAIAAQAQRAAIDSALEQTGGNVAAAARLLGRDEKGLYRTMDRLGMGPRRKRKAR